jgi:hypothetical protein
MAKGQTGLKGRWECGRFREAERKGSGAAEPERKLALSQRGGGFLPSPSVALARMEISEAVSAGKRLGWPPAYGRWRGSAADQERGVERHLWKFAEGATLGEREPGRFQGAVFQRGIKS